MAHPSYPPELAAAEAALRPGRPGLRVGLALSGGGIRSATFSLGLLQALARRGLLGQIDVLSTVSGGGYIGSFLGGLFVGPRDRQATDEDRRWLGDVAAVERSLSDDQSPPIDWLRENGRYLSPNGAGDLLVAAAVVLRNWVAVQVVLCVLILTGLLALILAREASAGKVAALLQGTPWAQGDLFLLACLAGVLPCLVVGWAYWLLNHRAWLGAAAVAGCAAWAAGAQSSYFAWLGRPGALGVAAVATLALACAGLGYLLGAASAARRLSEWLRACLIAEALALVLLGVDRAGLWVYEHWGAQPLLGLPALTAALGLVQRFVPLLGLDAAGKSKRRLPVGLLADLAAVALVAGIVVALASVAYGLGYDWAGAPQALRPDPQRLLGGLGVALLVSWVCGLTTPFLNNSSLGALYGARLARAYLGASNPLRWKAERRVTRPLAGDDVPLRDYEPHRYGGPLHLVNVTLNETVSGTSNIEQQDRKGLNMAIGPAGISVGRTHHALWESLGKLLQPVPVPGRFAVWGHAPNRDFDRELKLSEWVSISGAAFTTGLGARTRIGFSLLLGFFNVRLGHWWNSNVGPWKRALASRNGGALPGHWWQQLVGYLRVAFSSTPHPSIPASLFTLAFRAHSYLLDEFLARFHGPARTRWYLSDGGHFENTGAYELIRRRVPFIVVSDNGCDPEYQLEDLGGLVRKARLDFGTEVRFLSEPELTAVLAPGSRACFGTWSELRHFEGSGHRPYATLARLDYPDAPPGLMLVIKPGLRGDEPLDVITYWRSNREFPQQTTADQFFDESQWESYRRLGLHIGALLFAPADTAGWSPARLEPPPR